MSTFIALLRGINVSGQKKVPMAELRALLETTGFKNVSTYIQSGNVILESTLNKETVQKTIEKAIFEHFKFEVPVLVITPSQLQEVFDASPFKQQEKEKSYFMLLYSVPEHELKEKVSKEVYPNEKFIITDDCVYFYCSTAYGKAKCGNNFFERKLKITATSRNYKTMVKLLSLSAETS